MTRDDELIVIERAKLYYVPDPSLSVYMCRDLQIVKDANLTDLAWALCKEGCHRNDVIGFFELLDKYIQEKLE